MFCQANEFCCGGSCIKDKPDVGCCHDFTYDTRINHCCPLQGKDDLHVCALVDETCCGEGLCCKHDELCCGGSCIKDKPDVGCCHDFTYDTRINHCCPLHGKNDLHVCDKQETCCGLDGCCKQDEECCGKGAGAHCVPKGKCGKRCGGKVCAQNETCCNGHCCPDGHCHNGQCLCGGETCPSPMHCCHGHQCCTGVCCHDSCCVGATDQCCSNNGGCCGAKDICCPGGCCIYGCNPDGGCAPPPMAPDVRLAPRRPTLMRRRGHA